MGLNDIDILLRSIDLCKDTCFLDEVAFLRSSALRFMGISCSLTYHYRKHRNRRSSWHEAMMLLDSGRQPQSIPDVGRFHRPLVLRTSTRQWQWRHSNIQITAHGLGCLNEIHEISKIKKEDNPSVGVSQKGRNQLWWQHPVSSPAFLGISCIVI